MFISLLRDLSTGWPRSHPNSKEWLSLIVLVKVWSSTQPHSIVDAQLDICLLLKHGMVGWVSRTGLSWSPSIRGRNQGPGTGGQGVSEKGDKQTWTQWSVVPECNLSQSEQTYKWLLHKTEECTHTHTHNAHSCICTHAHTHIQTKHRERDTLTHLFVRK